MQFSTNILEGEGLRLRTIGDLGIIGFQADDCLGNCPVCGEVTVNVMKTYDANEKSSLYAWATTRDTLRGGGRKEEKSAKMMMKASRRINSGP